MVQAIRNHFNDKSVLATQGLRLMLIDGRSSLVIGLGFMALGLFGAELLSEKTSSAFLELLNETPLICGCVAMWRPIQTFLDDWWPIARRSRICRGLGHSTVHVVADRKKKRRRSQPVDATP